MTTKHVRSTENGRLAGEQPAGLVRRISSAHTHVVSALAFSTEGGVLVSGSYDGTVKTWDTRTGRKIATQRKKLYRWAIVSLAMCPDGHTVASVSEAFQAPAKGHTQPFLWDLLSRQPTELARREKFQYQFSSPAFSPSGEIVAFGGDSIQLFDVASGERIGEPFKGSACNVITSVPDGSAIVSGHHDGQIGIWDVRKCRRLRRLKGHTNWVTCFCFSPDERLLASASDDHTIRLWDFEAGKEKHPFTGDWDTTTCLAFLPDSKQLVSFHDPDNHPTARLWSPGKKSPLAVWMPGERVQSMAVSRDGTRIATGDWFGNIRLWEAASVWASSRGKRSSRPRLIEAKPSANGHTPTRRRNRQSLLSSW